MRAKSKELLNNLKNITAKKDRFATKPLPSSTNRIWKSSIESGIHSLPKSYDKDKWIVDEEDEDKDSFKYIDRMYGGLFGYQSLQQKDGTTYKGKINTKRIKCKDLDGSNFYSFVHETDDGRWFDRCGKPIDKPKNLVTREPKEEDDTWQEVNLKQKENPTNEL